MTASGAARVGLRSAQLSGCRPCVRGAPSPPPPPRAAPPRPHPAFLHTLPQASAAVEIIRSPTLKGLKINRLLTVFEKPSGPGWIELIPITRGGGASGGKDRELTQGTILSKIMLQYVTCAAAGDLVRGIVKARHHAYLCDNASGEGEIVVLAPSMTDDLKAVDPAAWESWVYYERLGFRAPPSLAVITFASALNKASGSLLILSRAARRILVVCCVARNGRNCARYKALKELFRMYKIYVTHSDVQAFALTAIVITDATNLVPEPITPRPINVAMWIDKCPAAAIVLITRSKSVSVDTEVSINVVTSSQDVHTSAVDAPAASAASAAGGGGGSSSTAASSAAQSQKRKAPALVAGSSPVGPGVAIDGTESDSKAFLDTLFPGGI